MAIRGRRPTITMLKPLKSTKDPGTTGEPIPGGVPEPSTTFTSEQRELWDRYIAPCFWLSKADEPKAHMFVSLFLGYLADPENVSASRIKQLRLLGSELGLDPTSRSRMGRKQEDPLDRYR